MIILYLDVPSLLLSNKYIANNPDVANAKELWTNKNPSEFLRRIRLDPESLSMLIDFCRDSGVQMFPLGTRYSRECLLAQGVDSGVLAEDVPLQSRMDDSSAIRRMLLHAAAIGADDWLVIGDVDIESLKPLFTGHYIDSVFGEGVTPDLISKLYEQINSKK